MDKKKTENRYVFMTDSGKWRVSVSIFGKLLNFGTYDSIDTAEAVAREVLQLKNSLMNIETIKIAEDKKRVDEELINKVTESKDYTEAKVKHLEENLILKKTRNYLNSICMCGNTVRYGTLSEQIDRIKNPLFVSILKEFYVKKIGIARLMCIYNLSERQLRRKLRDGCLAFYKANSEVVDNA